MEKESSNELLQVKGGWGKGIGKRWGNRIGRIEDAACPGCGEGVGASDHIVFLCKNIRRVKDERGRREWAREEGIRWDSWDASGSRKWVRMEDSGQIIYVYGIGTVLLNTGISILELMNTLIIIIIIIIIINLKIIIIMCGSWMQPDVC